MPAWNGSVITIVMENKSQADIIGNSNAPYINSLVKQHALAGGYHDPFVHPSEANYIWMVAGENFDGLDDGDPAAHHLTSTSHIADQLEHAGITWKAYEESMGESCGLVSKGRYAAKHDPFVYFNDINGWDGTSFHPSPRCTEHVVDFSQLAIDIANHALPKYVFITPNLDDDMHDGSVTQGDTWLSKQVPQLMATDAYKHGGVIFLLWDEGSGTPASDDPPFIAISPNIKSGMVSMTDYDASSYLKTMEAIVGVDSLPCATTTARDAVATMDELFTVPMTAAAKTATTADSTAPAPQAAK